MADELSIHALLRAHAGFAGLIGGTGTAARLWDQMIPPRTPQPVTLPYVIATTISNVPGNTLDGLQMMGSYRMQFDIYADSKASARAVEDQLRLALASVGYDRGSRDLPASDPELRRISVDWLIPLAR